MVIPKNVVRRTNAAITLAMTRLYVLDLFKTFTLFTFIVDIIPQNLALKTTF